MSASSKPTPIAIPNDLAEKIEKVAGLVHLSKQDVMKLAMRIGLEDLKRCKYDIAAAIVDRAHKSEAPEKTASEEQDIALLAEKTSQYRTGKKGRIDVRNAAAPLPTYLVMRKGYILEPRPTDAKMVAASQPS
jgi:hypothetical protein